VTFWLGTLPSEVGELKVHVVLKTVWPPCMTVMVALVKLMPVMFSVHDVFGQSGEPGIGVVGGSVVTRNATLPFLISLAGMASLPVTCTGAGF
jgi:hypothetical protein